MKLGKQKPEKDAKSPTFQASTMTTEKLCLKWNDFQNIVQTSFGDLRSVNDFTDVTLACEGQSIKAHKVILSACSPFFKRLLKTHPNPQPLIYMRGVKYNDLVAVVDFIYQGEANIFQEQLENFLNLAEELELKGLNGSSEEGAIKDEPAPEYFIDRQNRRDVVNTQRTTNAGTNLKSEGNRFPIRNAMMPMMESNQRPTTSVVDPQTMATIESMIEKRLDGYICTKCDFKSNRISNMKEHTEKHIEGLEYPCNSCKKVFRSSQCLRKHNKRDRCQNL